MATARDGCVVVTAPLAAELRTFVARWNRDRPPRQGGKFNGGDRRAGAVTTETADSSSATVVPVGAIRWLAAETRASDPLGVGIPEKTIARVAAHRSPTTGLAIADAIVGALGRPEWFHDGTLTVLPNPAAPRAARAACCGGSLTGAVDPIQ